MYTPRDGVGDTRRARARPRVCGAVDITLCYSREACPRASGNPDSVFPLARAPRRWMPDQVGHDGWTRRESINRLGHCSRGRFANRPYRVRARMDQGALRAPGSTGSPCTAQLTMHWRQRFTAHPVILLKPESRFCVSTCPHPQPLDARSSRARRMNGAGSAGERHPLGRVGLPHREWGNRPEAG